MKLRICVLSLLGLFWVGVSVLLAVSPTVEEMADRDSWVGAKFEGLQKEAYSTKPFFSFLYNGQPSADFLEDWKLERSTSERDANRTEYTLTYTDPKTKLAIRCVGIQYRDFPTVEWVLYLVNRGSTDTPIISDVQSLDVQLASPRDGRFLLHHWIGFHPVDLQPNELVLKPNAELRFSSIGGRPTAKHLPNYNLEMGEGGVIVVIGWPGQWASRFTCDADLGLQIRAGQELTHFKLHPGEEVRTPRIVLQFYQGDWVRAQNIWRRWMTRYNVPKPGGDLPKPMFATSASSNFGFFGMTEENQKQFLASYMKAGLKPDAWWTDCGWFLAPQTDGRWGSDPVRFPNGLKSLSEYVHSKGMKHIVWIQPEQCVPAPSVKNWICENHPEWLLKAPPGHEADINQGEPIGNRMIVNLGDPAAWKWTTETISNLIDTQAIDILRLDYNIEPLLFWRAKDAEDRQGITEARYIAGFLAFYDELLKRYPRLLIDNCASGGQRNDLETMRRSVPLWRSDSGGDPDVEQTQTYGLAFWLPYFGHGLNVDQIDTYGARSSLFPSIVAELDGKGKDLDLSTVRRVLEEEWRTVVAPNYYGDYYPLLPATTASDIWVAWQLDRPEEGQGVVQVFRRQENTDTEKLLKLRGLDPNAMYIITNLDEKQPQTTGGRKLVEKGLHVTIPDKRRAIILSYRKTELK